MLLDLTGMQVDATRKVMCLYSITRRPCISSWLGRGEAGRQTGRHWPAQRLVNSHKQIETQRRLEVVEVVEMVGR